MERLTITEIAQLQIGDRFTFPGKGAVWQVVQKTSTHVIINQFYDWGVKIHRHDEMKKNNTQVRFLRNINDKKATS